MLKRCALTFFVYIAYRLAACRPAYDEARPSATAALTGVRLHPPSDGRSDVGARIPPSFGDGVSYHPSGEVG